MRTVLTWACIASTAVTLAVPAAAFADDGYFAPPAGATNAPQKGDIVIDTPGERTNLNIAVLSTTAGIGAVLLGIGALYTLQANSDAMDLGSPGAAGVTWDAAHQAKQDQLHDDNRNMAICYGAGGALVIAAAIALIVTEPKGTHSVIHPNSGVQPVAAPTAGGATFGARWSF
jgi:hypothetical protein